MRRLAFANDDMGRLRRLASGGVVLAAVLAVLSVGAGLMAVGWDLEALTFGDVDVILAAGADAAPLWRWSMLLDMFYSYLLLVPLALYAHRRLRDRGPWLADLGLIGAFAYISLGGASAAILGIAGASLIESYATAAVPEQAAIETSFRLLRDVFYFGVWQTFDPIAAGTWLLSVGWLSLTDRPVLGRLLVAASIGFGLFAVATMLGVHSLSVLLAIALGVCALWLAWLARDRVHRGPRPRQAKG